MTKAWPERMCAFPLVHFGQAEALVVQMRSSNRAVDRTGSGLVGVVDLLAPAGHGDRSAPYSF